MTRDTAERARELYYNLKPECQPHSDGCKGCADNLADIEKLLTQIQAEARERLAAWMVEHSFSTGHGDTFEDLLKELDWQVKELRQKVAEATLAEHESHVQFESELYAILVDPVAEGSVKEAEMRKALTEAALRSRELANKLNFTDLLKAAQEGLEIWAAKPGNHKWWKRIDGTPIPNDLLVNIVQRIAALAQALQPATGDK